jgi:hypothetical protein
MSECMLLAAFLFQRFASLEKRPLVFLAVAQSFMFLQLLSLGVAPAVAFGEAKSSCRQVCGVEHLSVKCIGRASMVSTVRKP